MGRARIGKIRRVHLPKRNRHHPKGACVERSRAKAPPSLLRNRLTARRRARLPAFTGRNFKQKKWSKRKPCPGCCACPFPVVTPTCGRARRISTAAPAVESAPFSPAKHFAEADPSQQTVRLAPPAAFRDGQGECAASWNRVDKFHKFKASLFGEEVGTIFETRLHRRKPWSIFHISRIA